MSDNCQYFDENVARHEFANIVRSAQDQGRFADMSPEHGFFVSALSYSLERFLMVTNTDFSKGTLQDFLEIVTEALAEEREPTIRLIKDSKQ